MSNIVVTYEYLLTLLLPDTTKQNSRDRSHLFSSSQHLKAAEIIRRPVLFSLNEFRALH